MHTDGVSDPLLLSGLQHFCFCPRQWALIHIEDQWAENVRTVEGNILHEKCHDNGARERRGDILILRDLRVFSRALNLSGACDVVEFHRDPQGVALYGEDGYWKPFPIEYKRGKAKENRADEVQLCAQAMCLEEMLCCQIEEGALFYGEHRRKQIVPFEPELRGLVQKYAAEMGHYYARGYTPKVKPRKGCQSCSLKEICLPKLLPGKSAREWIQQRIGEGL